MTNPHLTVLSPVARARHPRNLQTLNALANEYPLRLCEVHGLSEVSRARNFCATYAEPIVRERGGLVLWLDDDMTVHPQEFFLHARVVAELGHVVSGRAVTRQNGGVLAASILQGDEREPIESAICGGEWTVRLDPVLAGLACLLMPAEVFLKHLDTRPRQKRATAPPGRPLVEILATCPRIEPHEEMGHVFISEDNCYSLDLIELGHGPHLAELKHTETGAQSWLDYGHVAEQVMQHAPKAHQLVEGFLK